MDFATESRPILVDARALRRQSKNFPVASPADVTDATAAPSRVGLEFDFHALLESPIVLDEDATSRFREIVATERVPLDDAPIPLDAV